LKIQPINDYVITKRKGKPKTAAAFRDAAWRDGLVRAKLGEMD